MIEFERRSVLGLGVEWAAPVFDAVVVSLGFARTANYLARMHPPALASSFAV